MAAPERPQHGTARPAVGDRGARRGARRRTCRSCRAWATLLVVAAGAWRWAADRRRWPLPPRWLRDRGRARGDARGARHLPHGERHRGRHGVPRADGGREAARDARRRATSPCWSSSRISCCTRRCCATSACRSCPTCWSVALFATAALMRVHAGTARRFGRATCLRRTGALLLQALPLALLLFVLFPRLPGPFWGIGAGESARTGLGDEMTPGDISDLSVSGEVAFRVRFDGDDPAARRSATGAARCCTSSTGAAGAGRRRRRFPDQDVRVPRRAGRLPDHAGADRPPLDRGARHARPQWPEREAYRSYDFQLVAPRRLTEVSSFRLRSYPRFVAGAGTAAIAAQQGHAAAARGQSAQPRARRANSPRGTAATRSPSPSAMLTMFREQPFVYTLDPPKLADNAMDEFLFETRRGFCEHYASAFTMVMRAAGVPGARRHGLPGRRVQPDRRLPDRAPVRRPRLVRDLGGGSRLAARRSRRRPWRRSASSAAWSARSARTSPRPGGCARRATLLAAGRARLGHGQRLLERARGALQRRAADEPARAPRRRCPGLAHARARHWPRASRRSSSRCRCTSRWRYRASSRATGRRACTPRWCAGCAAAASRRAPTEGPVAFLERAGQACPDLARDLAVIRAPVRGPALRSAADRPPTCGA